MRRATRTTALLVVAGLVVASCSGDDDADSPSTSTAPTPPASTTETTVGLATTTTARPSTTATSSVPATPEPLSDEEAVLAAYQAAYDAYYAAAQDPDDPELRRQLQATHSGEYLDFLTERLDRRQINGEVLVLNPDVKHGFVVESLEVDDRIATLMVCSTDPWIVMRVGPQGENEVVDDNTYVLREEYTLVRAAAGAWTVDVGITVEDFTEQGSCRS